MAAAFNILPLSRFESGQTSIRRPKEFLYFSFDENHEIKLFSNDSLRYYYSPFTQQPGTPVPPVNLSNGFDQWIKSDQSTDKHLSGLLDTIQAYEERLMTDGLTELSDVRTKADFMTWRGMMTKVRTSGYHFLQPNLIRAIQIMTAGFDIFSDFEMNGTCYQVRSSCPLTLFANS